MTQPDPVTPNEHNAAILFRAALPMVMRVADVARAIGISERSVLAWIRSGSIPAKQIGRTWLIDREDFRRAVQARLVRCADCAREIAEGIATPATGGMFSCPSCSEQLRRLIKPAQGGQS